MISALAGRCALEMGPAAATKDDLLTETTALTGVLVRESLNLSGGISILGSGVTGGKSRSTTIHRGDVSPTTLKEFLVRLLQRVCKMKYAGALLHLNNLELLARDDPRRLTRFFDESRDCLQTKNAYFVFVGYAGMFQEVVVPVERVRSIFFGHPIHLPPLSLEDVRRAIYLRYKLLVLPPGKWIPPVADELIDHLYAVFNGRIRFIMDAVTTCVTRLPEGVTATLSAPAARELLEQLAQERVRALLTDAEQRVLFAAVKKERFTNSSLAQATGKSKQNVAKYLRRFVDLNFVSFSEKRGLSVYYDISAELALLGSSEP